MNFRCFSTVLSLALAGPILSGTPIEPLEIIRPTYPPALWASEAEGTATIEFEVNREGKVLATRVVSATRPEFGEAARVAAADWLFSADPEGPEVRRVQVPFPFAFTIQDRINAQLKREVYRALPEEPVDASAIKGKVEPKVRVKPVYPPELFGTGIKDEAVVEVIVTPEGEVVNPRIVSLKNKRFVMSALFAAASTVFPPYSVEGKPVYVRTRLTFKIVQPAVRTESVGKGGGGGGGGGGDGGGD